MPWREFVEEIRSKGFAVRDGVCAPAELQEVQGLFTSLTFASAQIGRGETLQQRRDIRSDETHWIETAAPPPELRPVLARIEELRTQLNRQLFLGLGEWEAHLARYAPGAFYRRHLDRHRKDSRRIFSLILYLNTDWQTRDGGELVVYSRAGTELQRILPVGGRLVGFLSDEFPHEVLVSQRERRSLTGWFLSGGSHVSAL